MKKSNPKISVIVPIYGTEKFLKKCLDSIIYQTYKNLEIICVNDCSKDSSMSILEEYSKKDNRIKIVCHRENKGLFGARVSGASIATGDYIAFVDSDDYLSCDFYRRLISVAKKENSDITIGKTIHENETGYQWVHNSYHNLPNETWDGENVLNNYLEQEGECFIWHTIWNKLYSKTIWDKSLPFFKTIKDHIIMCEDVLFSSIIHYYAKKVATTDYAYYFYMQHDSASTALNNNFSKYKKNINDLIKCFKYVENFYKLKKIDDEKFNHFLNWKNLYSRFWFDNVFYSQLKESNKKMLYNILKEGFELKELKHSTASDNYFYHITTPWDNRYEKLIENICYEKNTVISFDIFDTIFVRPFYKPSDLFITLNKTFDKLNKNNSLISFSDIRILSEKEVRNQLSEKEEVTLDEIYNYIEKVYHIKKEICEKIKNLEIETELKYLKPRKSILNIIDLANFLNKQVICVSDFYMDKSFIENLFKKHNIKINKLYISCDLNKTKNTGSLFTFMLNDLNVKPKQVLHIGDNWDSDYLMAKSLGINAVFYANCITSFMYGISDIKSSKSIDLYKKPSGFWINFEKSLTIFEVRCAFALCANNLYDNPYYCFNEWTEFNSDANFMGYYALGMHLWSISKWLYENNLNKKGKIHFIARDGYLPKMAYDIINKEKNARPSNYIHVSRKSLMPLIILNKDSFFGIGSIINLSHTTPKDLLTLFEPILNINPEKEINKNILNEPFSNDNIAYDFISKKIIPLFDQKKMENYRKEMKLYFSNLISKEDTSFDIGYSGRTQILLSTLLGFPINGYHIHANNDLYIRKQKDLKINIQNYYNFSPSITGNIREVLISELSPSCIGYDLKNKTPKFENKSFGFCEKFAINQIQKQALNFVKDMFETFGLNEDFCARHIDMSAPYEYLIHCAKADDTKYFNCFIFEDDLWNGYKSQSLSDIWQQDMAYHHVLGYTKPIEFSYPAKNVNEQGIYAKVYQKLNKMFPYGTKRRKFAKKLASFFVKK